ncbi:hypothetical protein MGN70_006344 [Eutypa lata]|nr:hypothetical protein MGN70_006344 [Eutypa lata]
MVSSKFQEDSHYEHTTPPASIHGGRGDDGQATSTTPARESGDASSSGGHVQEKGPAAITLTKRQKLRRHCGKFWLWYLIGGLILLAILLPILFLVILPAIVQRIINNQPMPVNGGSLIALTPTQLKISLDTALDTPLPADIDPTTLFLYNKNGDQFAPFVNVTLPPLHVDGDTDIVVKDQIVTITNETELIKWFEDVFDNPTVDLSTRGDSTVHLGKLHYGAHIEKTVTVNSLNKLEGFGIETMQLMMPPEANGTNIQGTLNLPNWGTLALSFGDIKLNLMSGDIRIGLITIYDVFIPPGNNSLYFNGELFLGTLVQNFGTILASQTDALADGNIQIDATGNATTVNGERISFIEAVLNKRRVTSMISLMKLGSDLINSFTGSNQASLTDLIDNLFGNSTLIDDILGHWNTTANSGTSEKRGPQAAAARSSKLNLLKLGMKMKKMMR